MEALDADLWEDDSDVEIVPASPSERAHKQPAQVHMDEQQSTGELPAPAGCLQPASTGIVRGPDRIFGFSSSLPPAFHAALRHACALWLDSDVRCVGAHLRQHPDLAGLAEAECLQQLRAVVLDTLGGAIAAAADGVLLQECLLHLVCVPSGVLFAVRFSEGGLVYSAAAGPVGMPEAFVAEVHSMEHRWAALVDMSVLVAVLEGLSVQAALELVAVGYGLAAGLPS
jgi:hypothetical protein